MSSLARVENLRWPQSPGTRSRNFFKLFSPCLFGSLLPYVIRDVRKIDADLCGLKTDHKRTKSTHMLERLSEEIKRQTRTVRIFPNRESCFRLLRVLATEIHGN